MMTQADEKENQKTTIIMEFLKKIPRWNLCPAEPEEDDDGPLYQGMLTDPKGALLRWEDIERELSRLEGKCPNISECNRSGCKGCADGPKV